MVLVHTLQFGQNPGLSSPQGPNFGHLVTRFSKISSFLVRNL